MSFWILTNELFAKDFRSLDASVPIENNLSGKLVSSLESPITFVERFKVTLVPFLILDFNLLSCELDDFTFKMLHESFYIDFI